MPSHSELLNQGIRRGHEYLASFAELQDDWNGEGGALIRPEAITLAHQIMDVIGTDKFICPENEGGVEFEWDVDESGNKPEVIEGSAGTYIVTVLYLPKDRGKPPA